jgi:predicted transcriptional regulator
MSDVPLKEYLEKRLDEMSCRIKQRFEEVDANVAKAEQQLNHRLEGMNEFRESLRDQSSRFMTRMEYEYAHKGLDEKVRAMELAKATLEGRAATVSVLISVVVSVVTGVVIALVIHYVIK